MMKSLFGLTSRKTASNTNAAVAPKVGDVDFGESANSQSSLGRPDPVVNDSNCNGSATEKSSLDRPAKRMKGLEGEGDTSESDEKESAEDGSPKEKYDASQVREEETDERYADLLGYESDGKLDEDESDGKPDEDEDYIDADDDSDVGDEADDADDEVDHKSSDGEGNDYSGNEDGNEPVYDASSYAHPLVGRRAKIVSGPDAGWEGTLVAVGSRGWWTLDNRARAVRSRQCMLVKETDEEVEARDLGRESVSGKRDRSNRGLHWAERNPHRSTSPNRCEGESAELKLRMSDLVENAAEPPSANIYSYHGELLEADKKAGVLPPIVLDGPGIPTGLEHLDAKTQLQIFDRKLGIILKDRVSVDALSALLREHAEYEPIVPPRVKTDAPSVRQGRTDPDLLICAEVRPQTKRLKGKKVVITSGLYRGREGQIQTSIPGGWYLVGGILNDISLVVSPENVEEILEGTTASSRESEKELQPNNREPNGNNATRTAGDITADMHELHSTFNDAIDATIR